MLVTNTVHIRQVNTSLIYSDKVEHYKIRDNCVGSQKLWKDNGWSHIQTIINHGSKYLPREGLSSA